MKKRLLFVNLLVFFTVFSFSQSMSGGAGLLLSADTALSRLTVCYGTTDTIYAAIDDTNPPYRFSWRAMGDTLSCDTCQTTVFFATQNSTYIVTIMDSDSVSYSDTIVVTVSGGNNVNITSSGVDTFCLGGMVTLSSTFSATSYQWTRNGSNIADAITDRYVVADTSGNYQLTVIESGGCPGTSNVINVNVMPGVTAVIAPQGPVNVCVGTTPALQANAGANYNYEWMLDDVPIAQDSGLAGITAAQAGAYQVIVSNAYSCRDTSNVVIVNINALPIVYFPTGSSDTLCANGNPVTLTGGTPEGGIYSGPGVASDSIFNPANAQVGVNEIVYTYTGPNNCSNTAHEPVLVESCTEINNLSAEDAIALYPNPANESITLESDMFAGSEAYPAVYDIDGKTIAIPFERDGSKIKINTSALSNGVYLVRLNLNGATINKRFIKAE